MNKFAKKKLILIWLKKASPIITIFVTFIVALGYLFSDTKCSKSATIKEVDFKNDEEFWRQQSENAVLRSRGAEYDSSAKFDSLSNKNIVSINPIENNKTSKTRTEHKRSPKKNNTFDSIEDRYDSLLHFSPPGVDLDDKPYNNNSPSNGKPNIRFGDAGPAAKRNPLQPYEPYPNPIVPQPDEAHLKPARIAYDIPEAMNVEKSHRVIVSITTSMSSLVLYNGLNPSNMKDEELLVTKLVRVNLIEASGENNFSIKSLATERQTVDDTTNTVWRWDVIPLRGGTYSLMIRATVQTGKESEKDITVFERTVQVQAGTLHGAGKFIGAYWQFLLSAIVLPSIIWGYKRFISKGKGKKVDDSVYV